MRSARSSTSSRTGSTPRWLSAPEMAVGQWVEVPIDDDGPPQWMEVADLMSPRTTMEYRWAIDVRRAGAECWLKVAPWLRFRTVASRPECAGGPEE